MFPHLHEQDVRARCSRQNCLTFQRPEISERGQRHQLSDFSGKIDANVQPVYTSQKIKGQFKPKERKLPIVNQIKCGLCGGDWLHESTLTSTCGGTQAINNRQPRKGCAWKGSGDQPDTIQTPLPVPDPDTITNAESRH